jgi:hypothetical protein
MLDRLKQTLNRERDVNYSFESLIVPFHVQSMADATGLVLLNVRSGLVFRANLTGARLWQAVTGAVEPGAAMEQLAGQYQISRERIASDADNFVAELLKYGLLVRRQGVA